MSTFNQGNPSVPMILSSSNVFLYGNTASGTALSVRQFGAGSVASFSNVAGSVGLFINSSAQVGIGRTDQSCELMLSNATTTSNTSIGLSKGVGSVFHVSAYYNGSASWMGIGGNGLPPPTQGVINITAGGNVGIGITSPGALFQVNASATNPSVPTVHIGDNSNDYNSGYAMVHLVRSGTPGDTKAHLSIIRNGNTGVNFGFYNNTNTFGIWNNLGNTGSTPTVGITTTGYVGIGTTNPNTYLSIQGTSGRTDCYGDVIEMGVGRGSDGPSFIDFHTAEATYSDYALRIIRYSGANGNTEIVHRGTGSLSLSVQEAGPILFITSAVERMRILANGNVSIGGTTPGAKFSVVLSGAASTAPSSWDANYVTFGTSDGSGGNAVSIGYNTASSFGALNCLSPGVAWRGMAYGAQLHDFYLNGSFAFAVRNYMTGGATTISVDASGYLIRGATSDARLKSNIVTMTDTGLTIVNALRPVTYEANELGLSRLGPGVHTGLVAQEVQEVFPNAVSETGDEMKSLGIDYIKLVPLLIKSVQELSAENKALKTRLDSLEARLAAAGI